MSNVQHRSEEYNKLMRMMIPWLIVTLTLKWILIIGLNRWARSLR